LTYLSIDKVEYITDLEAETLNLIDGKIEITKVDKKQIFTQKIDAQRSAITFAFPDVRPGSVIEFKYRLHTLFTDLPDWRFQEKIPERYNELITETPVTFRLSAQINTNQPFIKDTIINAPGFKSNVEKHIRAMASVPSFTGEPYMSSLNDNVQSIFFRYSFWTDPVDGPFLFDAWNKLADYLIANKYWGYEMNTRIADEGGILNAAKLLPQNEQKIAYIFNKVKTALKWNGEDTWYTDNGLNVAWKNKAGNSTEINLILQSVLSLAGIKAYPLMVSTHDHGKINPGFPSVNRFNRTVVFVAADNGEGYILDASDKYNLYNQTPANLLNSYGFLVDREHKIYKTIFIDNKTAVKETVFVNASITPAGLMEGTIQKSSYSYLKNDIVEQYKKEGNEKYLESLRHANGNMTITDLKFENMHVDSLPLQQNLNFKADLGASGDGYLYFSPNMLTSFKQNPFLAEKRTTDIDFSYLTDNAIVGIFQVPDGYKIDALPKSVSMDAR